MAGLLARGSLPCAAFPVSQWHLGARLAAYSCGGSRGFGSVILTAFPFDPRREPSRTSCEHEPSSVNKRFEWGRVAERMKWSGAGEDKAGGEVAMVSSM